VKVSKEQKEITRREIVNAAVELISEYGYQNTTMKKIAKKAGVGDATIYKYFTTKDKILLAYYEIKAVDTVKEIKEIESFSEFSLREKLQLLINSYLEHLLPDREFVDDTLKRILYTPLFLFKDIARVKKEFNDAAKELFEEAIKKKEITSFPLQNMIPELFSEYVQGIVLYWLKDDSEEFTNTTQMVDLSLDLSMLVLESGIIDKTMEIFSFLFKSHLLHFMSNNDIFMDKLKKAKTIFEQ